MFDPGPQDFRVERTRHYAVSLARRWRRAVVALPEDSSTSPVEIAVHAREGDRNPNPLDRLIERVRARDKSSEAVALLCPHEVPPDDEERVVLEYARCVAGCVLRPYSFHAVRAAARCFPVQLPHCCSNVAVGR